MKDDLLPRSIQFLKATSFFSGLSQESLEKLAKQFETEHIQGGSVLIQEGDKGDCLYLVISGHLKTIKKTTAGTITLGTIGQGELIGELALLTSEPRAATVVAIRDCLLLKLSKTVFDNFIYQYPAETMKIVKSALLRLLHKKQTTKNRISIIALVPSGNVSTHFPKFVADFVKELSQYGKILHLNHKNIYSLLEQHGVKRESNFASDDNTLYWLNEQELNYQYIIYETDDLPSDWCSLCIRQADKILLVGEINKDESLNKIEKDLFQHNIQQSVDLILINESDVLLPNGTARWLNLRKIDQHHHVKTNSADSLKRIIRYLTGNSIGLVLSGGGARGFAHIGVYKALLELGIPIDFIGGTSSGALVSCFFAFNYSPEKIIQIFKEGIVYKRLDYTLPITSITGGSVWTNGLKQACGIDVHIEDLWKSFFCVATNITTQKLERFNRGLLWKAIRASISLPAIAPPITNEKDEVLVDGGVLNNLPVDIMQSQINGSKIIASRILIGSQMKAEIPEGILSGWSTLFEKINPYNKNKDHHVPIIADIVISSMILSSKQHTLHILSKADYHVDLDLSRYKLFDFTAIDELTKIGYNETLKQLSGFDIKKDIQL